MDLCIILLKLRGKRKPSKVLPRSVVAGVVEEGRDCLGKDCLHRGTKEFVLGVVLDILKLQGKDECDYLFSK